MLLAVVQLFYERLRQGELVHVDAQPRRVRPVRPWRIRLQLYVNYINRIRARLLGGDHAPGLTLMLGAAHPMKCWQTHPHLSSTCQW